MISTYRKTTDERLYAAAEDAFTSEGGRPSTAQPELERQMAEFGIGYDGRQYGYNGDRYGRLADAIAYASLMRSRPTPESAGGTFMKRKAFAAPQAVQFALQSIHLGFPQMLIVPVDEILGLVHDGQASLGCVGLQVRPRPTCTSSGSDTSGRPAHDAARARRA